MKKSEVSIREMWGVIKHTNIHKWGVSGERTEEKERERTEKIQRNNGQKLPKFITKQSTHPGSSTNSKKDKHKQIHRYIIVKMLRVITYERTPIRLTADSQQKQQRPEELEREFVARRPTLKEIVKEVLQPESSDHRQ